MTNQAFNSASGAGADRKAKRNPYEQFSCDRLIMRDLLAIDRTILANERTLLSYFRTSLALILAGAGIMKFFQNAVSFIAGLSFAVLGLAVGVLGIWRSSVMASRIRAAEPGSRPTPDPVGADEARGS